jgi:hypothetical protein
MTLSDSVGYAWIAAAIAVAGTRPAIVATTSWIIAPASPGHDVAAEELAGTCVGHQLHQPERTPVDVRSLVLVEPDDRGAASWPASRAARSVSPTLATSGSQNVTRGTTR